MSGRSSENASWATGAALGAATGAAATGVGFGAEVERFLEESGRPLLEKPFPAEAALDAIGGVGGALAVTGGALLIYDLVKRSRAEHAAAAPVKKRKVKKVIEVEEATSMLLPVAGPNGVGFVGEIHF